MNLLKRIFKAYLKRTQNEDGFIAAVPYIMQGLGALGGIMAGKNRKYLDPVMLREKYGPAAVAREAQLYSNQILNSPYGQQLMASAATQGQELQTAMAGNAAASGLDASTGGASGASDFAAAAAPQAQAGLERGVKSDIWQKSLGLAGDEMAQDRALEVQNNETQNANNPWALIGQSAANAASMVPGQKKTV